MKQRSLEWYEMRLGKVTASEFHKVMGAKGLGVTGESYLFEKIAERMTGESKDIPETQAMRWGTELEPYAREYYEKAYKENIKEIGFLQSKLFPNYVGISPDGIVENIRGIEIKCPYNSENHVKYMTMTSPEDLLKVKKEYYWQIQLSLFCSDLNSWRFVSFDPRFTGKHRMFTLDIPKDEKIMQKVESRIIESINFIEEKLTIINNL